MAWFVGTTSNYRDLLAKIVEYAAADNVTSIDSIDAAGSGYVVGDIITVSGGTFTTAAQLEVATVGGSGEVTSLRVYHAGAYSVDPSSSASTTGGTGTGCQVTVSTTAGGWAIERYAEQFFALAALTISDPGSGYLVNDIVTVDSSGDAGTTPVTEATFRVTAVGGSGEVTAISVETIGEYSAVDGSGGLPLTGGTGSGLEIVPLFGGEASEDQLIMRGSGGGSDQIFVGARTFTNGGTGAKNWELAGMTAFSASLAWEGQPSISPGRYDDQSPIDGGCFFLLRDTTMNYWMSINSRRVIVIIQTGSNYHSAFMGFIDPLATSTTYPYPLLVMGTCTEPTLEATSSDIGIGGMPDPLGEGEFDDYGPGNIRSPGGVWLPVRNAVKDGSNLDRQVLDVVNIWPSNNRTNISVPTIDNWPTTEPSISFDDMIGDEPGQTPTYRLEPTPGTGDSLSPIFPLTLIDWSNATILGQMPDLYWVSVSQDGASSAISNDTFTLPNGDRYRVFQNVSRTSFYSFFCVKEN